MAQVTLEDLKKKLKSNEGLDRPEQLAFMQRTAERLKGRKLSGMTTYGKILAGSVQLDGFVHGHRDVPLLDVHISVDSADETFCKRAKDRAHFAMLHLSTIRAASLDWDAMNPGVKQTYRTHDVDGDCTEDLCMDSRGNLFVVRGRYNITLNNNGAADPTALVLPQRIEVITRSIQMLDILDQVERDQWTLQEAMSSVWGALNGAQVSLLEEVRKNSSDLQFMAGLKTLL